MAKEPIDLSHLSAQDRSYIESPSFETHIIAGCVFALCYTLSFVVPVMIHMAALFWPGIILSTIISMKVMRIVQRREYYAKIREVEENPVPLPRKTTWF